MIRTIEVAYKIGFSDGLSPYTDIQDKMGAYTFKYGTERRHLLTAFRKGFLKARRIAAIYYEENKNRLNTI